MLGAMLVACHSLFTTLMQRMCRDELSGVVHYEHDETVAGRSPSVSEGHTSFLVQRDGRWLATHAPTNSRRAQVLADHNDVSASTEDILQPGEHTWQAPLWHQRHV